MKLKDDKTSKIQQMNPVERAAYFMALYTKYSKLLRDKSKAILDAHYLEDLSLAEIAENEGVSRQAVHSTLKQTEKTLLDLESKLGLLEKEKERTNILEGILASIDAESNNLSEAFQKSLQLKVESLLRLNNEE